MVVAATDTAGTVSVGLSAFANWQMTRVRADDDIGNRI